MATQPWSARPGKRPSRTRWFHPELDIDRTVPVHRILRVEASIHIIEATNLQELANDGQYEFIFLAAPLKIEDATGCPIRPVAIVCLSSR